FCVYIMGPKKVSANDNGDKKKRMMSVELKQAIIEKHEQGMRVIELARLYDRSTLTICTILKQKDTIKSARLAKGTRILSQLRSTVHEEMEKLLLVWIKEKELAGDTLTETIISKKARVIYSNLKKKEPSTSTGGEEEFKASHGWFDVKAADEFITRFADLIKEGSYIPQQVFNCNETGLFWKKMPHRTFITAEETKMPGHKPMKDRLTLALCTNASGDCKVKPLLVYHSENPRTFKTHKILKEKLQVMWHANAKAWLRGSSLNIFSKINSRYNSSKSSTSHPTRLQSCNQWISRSSQILKSFIHLFRRCFEVTENTKLTLREFWKEHFNIVICLRIIDLAWQEVTRRTLNSEKTMA
uniref:HTH CENPB-type domain-containing protein n=1 Tax=Amphilophus citrinellus TaxID=61819 RepID=A0A3Q0T0S5_AMPCI